MNHSLIQLWWQLIVIKYKIDKDQWRWYNASQE